MEMPETSLANANLSAGQKKFSVSKFGIISESRMWKNVEHAEKTHTETQRENANSTQRGISCPAGSNPKHSCCEGTVIIEKSAIVFTNLIDLFVLELGLVNKCNHARTDDN